MAPVSFAPSIDAYIASFHARDGFSGEPMSPEDVATFDAALHDLIVPLCRGGMVTLETCATVIWGAPMGVAKPVSTHLASSCDM